MAEKLQVTVDKSHLITIGERLYTEAIELIRELVNNAYDADATEVRITMADQEIRIEDDGLGMDLQGLREYFTVGTPDKRLHPRSPRFQRERIGQFGIGKFATLAAAERFIVDTRHGDFHARVTFDKKRWEKRRRWELPLEHLPPDPARGDGTTVILSKLRKRFRTEDVERRILESVPLKAQRFAVYLNGRRLKPRRLPGHRVPFMEGTAFGPVHGEVVILPQYLASTDDMGLEVRVKGVLVRRELLGMERWGRDAARVRGEVNADFLPVTTDRSGFITDTEEHRAFRAAMAQVLEDVRRTLGRLSDKKERRRASRALKEAFQRIQQALARNPDLSPFGPVPYGEPGAGLGEAGVVPEGAQAAQEAKAAEAAEAEADGAGPAEDRPGRGPDKQPRKDRQTRPAVKRLTPNAVVQRMRMGQTGVTCCLDHFGPDGPEAFHEGTTIYVNRDHPLYKTHEGKTATHTLHIARLLTQEISLMKDPKEPREAYRRQSLLLRDAFVDEP